MRSLRPRKIQASSTVHSDSVAYSGVTTVTRPRVSASNRAVYAARDEQAGGQEGQRSATNGRERPAPAGDEEIDEDERRGSGERRPARGKAGDVVVLGRPAGEVVAYRDERSGDEGDCETESAERRPLQVLSAEHDAARHDHRSAADDREMDGLVEQQEGGHRGDQRRRRDEQGCPSGPGELDGGGEEQPGHAGCDEAGDEERPDLRREQAVGPLASAAGNVTSKPTVAVTNDAAAGSATRRRPSRTATVIAPKQAAATRPRRTGITGARRKPDR